MTLLRFRVSPRQGHLDRGKHVNMAFLPLNYVVNK